MRPRSDGQSLKIAGVQAHVLLIELGDARRNARQHVKNKDNVKIPAPEDKIPFGRKRCHHFRSKLLELRMKNYVVFCYGFGLIAVQRGFPEQPV